MTDVLDAATPKPMNPVDAAKARMRSGMRMVEDIDKDLSLAGRLLALGRLRGEQRPVTSAMNGLLDERLEVTAE